MVLNKYNYWNFVFFAIILNIKQRIGIPTSIANEIKKDNNEPTNQSENTSSYT